MQFQKSGNTKKNLIQLKNECAELQSENKKLHEENQRLKSELLKEKEIVKKHNTILNSIIENTDQLILITDEKGYPIRFNKAYSDTVKDLLGITMNSGIIPHKLLKNKDSVKYWDNIYDKVLSGKKLNIEYKHKTGKKEYKYYEIGLNPIIENKTIVGFTQFASDISERKKTSIDLKESQELFYTFIDNLPAMAFIMNKKGELIFSNSEFLRFFGSGNSKGLYTLNSISEKTIKKIRKSDEKVIKDGFDHIQQSFSIQGNKKIIFDIKKFKLDYNHKQLIGGILSDITKLKEAEDSLRLAKINAESADKLKSVFLANMSHEIRTPINGILGFANMLKQDDIDDELKVKYVNIICKSSYRLLNIINDILDISKIEVDEIIIHEKEFNLNEIIDELYDFFSEDIASSEKKIKLNVHKQFNDSESTIVADEGRIRQIMMNLLNNSFKFTRRGYIEFGYKLYKKNELLFYVKDSGVGISKDKHNKVFDRFSHSEDYLYTSTGAGLGLSIAKGLVNKMKGKIWFESIEKKGTNFYFSIPVIIKHNKKISTGLKVENNNNIKWKDKTVLIVEDDQICMEYLLELLKPTGINILQSSKGRHALDTFKKNPAIDLILMDIQLPDINGFDIIKIIRKTNKEIPVIAQTAYAMPKDKEDCIRSGCTDYIAKPIDKEKLYYILIKCLK